MRTYISHGERVANGEDSPRIYVSLLFSFYKKSLFLILKWFIASTKCMIRVVVVV